MNIQIERMAPRRIIKPKREGGGGEEDREQYMGVIVQ
jgi:hypothetical protein